MTWFTSLVNRWFQTSSRSDQARKRFCDNLAAGRSQIVDFTDGEMSEWFKEHAWKANPERLTERYRDTALNKGFNDFRSRRVPRCEALNHDISRPLELTLHSFYTISRDLPAVLRSASA
jgi:hypothetical protein